MGSTLIVRADDAGSSNSANKAIIKVLESGSVKNTSVMACCNYVKEFYELSKNLKNVTYGMHFVINSEWDKVKWGPVSSLDKSSGLVDDNGYFLPDPSLFIETKPKVEVIIKEAQAQLDKLKAIGFKISYLDSHMLPELYIEGLSEELSKFCIKNKLIDHKYYYVLFDYEKIKQTNSPLPIGQYFLLTHPSLDDEEMRQVGNAAYSGEIVAKNRASETELYSSDNFKQLLKAYDLKSISYKDAIPCNYDTIEVYKKGLK
jgi:predicted glycoside hydrolase/deacetylase ChbG (UPF0249 family)